MANQDRAPTAQNPPNLWLPQLRENEQITVAMDVKWDGTYCFELELGCFANLFRSSGSDQSPNRFVGSPFIQQKPHNYGVPIE